LHCRNVSEGGGYVGDMSPPLGVSTECEAIPDAILQYTNNSGFAKTDIHYNRW
jgi:hypothetical protein